MSSYKIYLTTCLSALLCGILTCESVILKCNVQENQYSPTCAIDNADYTEVTEFQLESYHDYRGHQYTTLQFINSRISNIPHGIFTKLPYLRYINFSNCHMLEVLRFDFIQAHNLIDINLSHNHLDVLKDSIFYGAPMVEQINLAYNKITQVSNSTFKNLMYLKRINLSNNQIKKIESTVFLDLIALRYIDLSVNLIESINGDDMYTNMNITEFDLSENLIMAVDQQAFINTKFIKMLDLNFNRVKNLSFVDVTINIETIRIGNNNLTVLQTNNNLRVLEAPNNQLTSANLIMGLNILHLSLNNNLLNNLDFIKPLSKLKQLDVSFNRLDVHLQPDTFALLSNLNILSLESVNLKKIDFELFAELKQLSFLDISYNELESINFQTLSFLENLTHLFIDGNRLTQLAFKDFEFLFPNLKTIAISENNWICTDLFAMLKYFKQINVEIYIDDSRLVKNETNIRGIQCTNDQNNTSIDNVSPKIPIIHNHDAMNNNYMFEINQTRIQLNTLQRENEQLQFDLNQMRSILDNITNTTPYFMNTSNVLENYTAHIINLTELYNGQINSINTRIKMQSEKFESISTGNYDPGYISSINSNLIVIKILLVGFFVIGVVCGALKLYKTLLYRRSYRPSYNTMADVINENNI